MVVINKIYKAICKDCVVKQYYINKVWSIQTVFYPASWLDYKNIMLGRYRFELINSEVIERDFAFQKPKKLKNISFDELKKELLKLYLR